MTQKAEVLNHLRTNDDITPLAAIAVYGIFRLAARIKDLREEGYDIQTQMRTDARGRNYARYSLNA